MILLKTIRDVFGMENQKPYSKIAELLGEEQPDKIQIINGVTVVEEGELNIKKFIQLAERL